MIRSEWARKLAALLLQADDTELTDIKYRKDPKEELRLEFTDGEVVDIDITDKRCRDILWEVIDTVYA